jgi:hypothetical protein
MGRVVYIKGSVCGGASLTQVGLVPRESERVEHGLPSQHRHSIPIVK